MSAAPRPRSTEPRDSGMTLGELMITIGLMGLLGTMVATVVILTVRTTAGLQDRLDDTSQSDLGVAAASKVLRTAVLPEQLDTFEDQLCTSGCVPDRAIDSATSTSVTFYSNLNNNGIGPSKVRLRVEQDSRHPGTAVLRQYTWLPRAGANDSYSFCAIDTGGCVPAQRILARGLVWPNPGIFTYYDYNGARLTGTAVSETNLPRIQSVDLVMQVRTDGSLGAPTRTLVTRVRLPNVEISINSDGTNAS